MDGKACGFAIFCMYKQTNAIVLYASKYPRGYIVHLYTREYGRLSCVVNDAKSHRSPFRKVLLQPLSLVEVVLAAGSGNALPRLRESRSALVYASIPYNFYKNSIAMFLAEFLSKVLREEQPDAELFDFVDSSLRFLDVADTSFANFHIAFLLQLSYFLGIAPNMENAERPFFDMLEARFVPTKPLHDYLLCDADKRAFSLLMRMNYRNMYRFRFTHAQRVAVLLRIVDYYQIHLGKFGSLRSLEVLQELFS